MEEIPQFQILDKYNQQFQQILNSLEQETGCLYQLNIIKHNSNGVCIIGDLNNRKLQVEVYDMSEEFKQLEGIYDSLDDVKRRITCLSKIPGNEHIDWSKLIVSDKNGDIYVRTGRVSVYYTTNKEGHY